MKTFLACQTESRSQLRATWVNLFSLKRNPFEKIFAWRRLRWKITWTWRMKVVWKWKSRLHFVQTQYCSIYKPIFSLFLLEKLFYCRFQFWLISWKKSQDDLAGLCLIKFNKRSNKWTNQEGTYVRASCPGLWELGPCTLPKLTVSLYGICHELKNYLKRREPDDLPFSCLKTSVTAGFLLTAMVACIAQPQPSAWQTPPPDCSMLEGRRQAVQAIGDHPANLWPGFFRLYFQKGLHWIRHHG